MVAELRSTSSLKEEGTPSYLDERRSGTVRVRSLRFPGTKETTTFVKTYFNEVNINYCLKCLIHHHDKIKELVVELMLTSFNKDNKKRTVDEPTPSSS